MSPQEIRATLKIPQTKTAGFFDTPLTTKAVGGIKKFGNFVKDTVKSPQELRNMVAESFSASKKGVGTLYNKYTEYSDRRQQEIKDKHNLPAWVENTIAPVQQGLEMGAFLPRELGAGAVSLIKTANEATGADKSPVPYMRRSPEKQAELEKTVFGREVPSIQKGYVDPAMKYAEEAGSGTLEKYGIGALAFGIGFIAENPYTGKVKPFKKLGEKFLKELAEEADQVAIAKKLKAELGDEIKDQADIYALSRSLSVEKTPDDVRRIVENYRRIQETKIAQKAGQAEAPHVVVAKNPTTGKETVFRVRAQDLERVREAIKNAPAPTTGVKPVIVTKPVTELIERGFEDGGVIGRTQVEKLTGKVDELTGKIDDLTKPKLKTPQELREVIAQGRTKDGRFTFNPNKEARTARAGRAGAKEPENVVERVSQFAQNSIKNDPEGGVREKALISYRENPEWIDQKTVDLREVEGGVIKIDDGRHALQVALETGRTPKFRDVTANYTGSPSAKVADLIRTQSEVGSQVGKKSVPKDEALKTLSTRYKKLIEERKSVPKDSPKYKSITREITAIEANKTFRAGAKVNPAMVAGGGATGAEVDENGNVTIDPMNALLGAVGFGLVSKAVNGKDLVKMVNGVAKKVTTPEVIPEHNTFEKAFKMSVEQKYEKTKASVDRVAEYLDKAKAMEAEVKKIPRNYSAQTPAQRDLKRQYEAYTNKQNKAFHDYWTAPSIADPKVTRVEALKLTTEAQKTAYRIDYIKRVKEYISKGYDISDEIVAQFPELKKAVDARARYEKGFATSFANKSIAVDETTKKGYGFKTKRQDGKAISPKQVKEITDQAEDLEDAIGGYKDIVEALDLTIAHTSGKFPFLRGDAGGLHMGSERLITIGVMDMKAYAHEMFHVFDQASGTMSKRFSKHSSTGGEYTRELINDARENMNGSAYQIERALKAKPDMDEYTKNQIKLMKARLSGYYRTDQEIFARLGEQYVAEKTGKAVSTDGFNYYTEALGYWDTETFNRLKPLIEKEIQSKIKLAREKLGTKPATFERVTEAPKVDKTPEAEIKPEAKAETASIQNLTKETLTPADVIPPETKANPINDLQQHPKYEEVMSQLEAEFSIADVGLAKGQDESYYRWSSFPKWIPSEIRSKELMDKVLKHLTDGTVPKARATREQQLYDTMVEEIQSRMGTAPQAYTPVLIKGTDQEAIPEEIIKMWDEDASAMMRETTEDIRETVSSVTLEGESLASKALDTVKPIKNTPRKAQKAREMPQNKGFELPEQTRLQYLRQQIQDKFERLEFTQKKIKEVGNKIDENTDAMLQQELYVGRTAERIDQARNTIIRDETGKGTGLLERMRKDGVTIEDLGRYMHAKHAGERNAKVATINEALPDGGSGLTNAEAKKILAEFEGNTKIKEYASEFREKVIKERIRILREEDLMTEEALEKIEKSYTDYVPLKVDQAEIQLGTRGKGFSAQGKDIKRVKGSDKARYNPVMQAIVDLEDTIIKAEKNKVGKSFLKLIRQNPNPAVWEVENLQYMPRYNKEGEVIMLDPKYKFADNVMEVREGGKIRLITIKDAPLAQAMKNLGTEKAVSKVLMAFNSYLRGVVTFYNPEFMLTNFQRDIQTALINVGGEKSAKLAGQVAKDIPTAMRAIYRETRGKKPAVKANGDDWQAIYKEMKEEGGRVGWFDLNEVGDRTKETIDLIERYNSDKTVDSFRRGIDGVAKYVSDMNESVEMAVRVSTYKNLVASGMSKAESARYAKNLTVNFNKKGNLGVALNSLYLFANAGIQGTTRIITALKYPKVRAIVAGTAVTAYGLNHLNSTINEEGYSRLSDFEKDSNLILMLPPDYQPTGTEGKALAGSAKDGYYLKLRLPYGYNIFKVFGDSAYNLTSGKKTVGEELHHLMLAIDGAFNPLSSGSLTQFASPTITDPIVQQLENKNWFGGMIKPEQPAYQPPVRESSLYFKGATEQSKAVTEWLNRITGGNEVEAGWIDISPEIVDHYVDFIAGGVGDLFNATVDTAVTLGKGDLPDVTEMPFIRKFIDKPFEQTEKFEMYDLLDKSATDKLAPVQRERFLKDVATAVETEQIDDKTGQKVLKEFLKNEAKIKAGEIMSLYQEGKKEEAIKQAGSANPLVDAEFQKLIKEELKKRLETVNN